MAWAEQVRALYDEAQAWLDEHPTPTQPEREQIYVMLVERLHRLGLRYAQDKKHPCQALAKRVLRHEDELLQFVLIAGLSADNNLAEGSIRPLVVVRKISGAHAAQEAFSSETNVLLIHNPVAKMLRPYGIRWIYNDR